MQHKITNCDIYDITCVHHKWNPATLTEQPKATFAVIAGIMPLLENN